MRKYNEQKHHGNSHQSRHMLPIISHVDTKNIVSKSGISGQTYAINPYVGCQHACKYCYAQFMNKFSGHVEPWGRYVDVKHWEPIENPHKYGGSEIFLSSVTDPYQPIEETEKRTRAVLEQLVGTTARINITTKSNLVLRDLDLLGMFDDVTVAFSLNTLDDSFRADMDNAASVSQRLNAMCVVHDTRIRCICFVAPMFLGITDINAIVDAVNDRCDEVWVDSLNIRDAYKTRIIGYIDSTYPSLSSLYRQIYDDGDWSYWNHLLDDVRKIAETYGIRFECGDGPTDDMQFAQSIPYRSDHNSCDSKGSERVCKIIRCFFSKQWKERNDKSDSKRKSDILVNLFDA